MNNKIGKFSSSEIHSLLSKGKIEMTPEELAARPKKGPGSSVKYKEGGLGSAALSYIQHKKWERKAGRSLSQNIWAKPTAWGILCEPRVFDLLGTQYHRMGTDDSIPHPQYGDFWHGTPDGIKYVLTEQDAIAEVKCPFTLTSFFTFAECANIDEVVENHPDGYKYKWQCVSNACIVGVNYAELIIYCPYEEELSVIREMAIESDNISTRRWIENSDPKELPFLIKGKSYLNMYTFRFEVTQSMKDELTEAVLLAKNYMLI